MSAVLSIVGLACILAAVVCGIIVLIAAFQENVVQGLLSLFVPFYILYYAFARYESEKKGLILGVWLGGGLLGGILQVVGGVLAVSQSGIQ